MLDVPSDSVEIRRVLFRGDNSNKCLTIWFNTDSGIARIEGVEESCSDCESFSHQRRWSVVEDTRSLLQPRITVVLEDPSTTCSVWSGLPSCISKTNYKCGCQGWWKHSVVMWRGSWVWRWLRDAPFSCHSDSFWDDFHRCEVSILKHIGVSCCPDSPSDPRKEVGFYS